MDISDTPLAVAVIHGTFVCVCVCVALLYANSSSPILLFSS